MAIDTFIEAGGVQGFISAQSPLSLPPGVLSAASNIRLDNQTVKARGGSQQIYTAGTNSYPSSGTVMGAFTGSLDGVLWHFEAIEVSGSVQVWACQDSVGTWSEITSTATVGAAFGTLRMNPPASGPIKFQIVHDQGFNGSTPHDVLVFQNGSQPPRVWGQPGAMGNPVSAAPFTSIVNPVPQPAVSTTNTSQPWGSDFTQTSLTSVATWSKSLPMPVQSYMTTGSGFTVSGSGSPSMTISRAITVGATAKLTFGNTVNLSNSSLIAMIIDSPDPLIWYKISIQIGDGTNLVTLWNPQSSTATADFDSIPSGAVNAISGWPMNVTQAIFPVPSWGTGSPGAVNPAIIGTIVVTWIGPNDVALASGTSSAISQTGSVISITMSSALAVEPIVGQVIVITGASPSQLNGAFTVASVSSASSFTLTALASGSYTASTQGTVSLYWPFGQAFASATFYQGVNNGGSSGSNQFLSIDPTNAGYGYTSPPAVVIPAPMSGGTQASATAVLGDGSTIPYDGVQSINLGVAGANYDPGNTTDSTVTLGPPNAPLFLNIVSFSSSEGVLGGCNWAVALGSSGSRTVGPRQIITNNVGDYIFNLEGSLTSGYEGLQIVVREDAYYNYKITYMMPTLTVVQTGVDTMLFFSQQLGNTDFYYSDQQQVGFWNGSSWTLDWVYTIRSYAPRLTQDLSFNAPDESIVCIPTGLPMADTNGRFFVGVVNSVWYSEFNLPFRFRQLIRYFTDSTGATLQQDPTSGGSYSKSGEIIQAIVALGAVPQSQNILGQVVNTSGMIYVVTNFNLYASSGYDALSLNSTLCVAKYGTSAPSSVGLGLSYFYFLANDGNVKRVEGWSIRDISVEVVDNITQNVPTARLPWACGSVANLRYFLACSQKTGGSTTTNASVLVWSEIRQRWESFDSLPSAYSAEVLLTDFPNGVPRMLAYSSLSSVPGVYTYDDDSQSSDVGTSGIALSVTSKEWTSGGGVSVRIGAIGIMADIATGDTLYTYRNYTSNYVEGGTQNPNSSISLSAPSATNYPNLSAAYRINAWDLLPAGAEDVSLSITLSGTVPALWNLYMADADIEPGKQFRIRSS